MMVYQEPTVMYQMNKLLIKIEEFNQAEEICIVISRDNSPVYSLSILDASIMKKMIYPHLLLHFKRTLDIH